MIRKTSESGQALVLVLLSLAVVLTIVLFILSRTVTDISISSRSEEATRAFSAAEAGVEKALVVGSSLSSTQIGTATYTANVSTVAEGTNFFIYPVLLNSGEDAAIWFVSHDSNENPTCADNKCFTGKTLKVCWGNPGTGSSSNTTPAVELAVFYDVTPNDPSTVQVARVAMDPYSGRSQNPVNSFDSTNIGACTIGTNNEPYQFGRSIDLSTLGIPSSVYNVQGGLQFATLRLFYNTDAAHKVGFDVSAAGNSTLPSQGSQIDATGSAGESNRRLNVFQGWPLAPSIFMNVVFSSGSLKQ